MLEHMTAWLAAGGRIEIRGFGSFSLHHRRGRVGRNPRAGTPVSIPARYVPYFKPGEVLRERVDGAAPDPWRSGLEIAVPADASPHDAWVLVERLDGTVFAR